MRKCPNCGSEVTDNAEFCIECKMNFHSDKDTKNSEDYDLLFPGLFDDILLDIGVNDFRLEPEKTKKKIVKEENVLNYNCYLVKYEDEDKVYELLKKFGKTCVGEQNIRNKLGMVDQVSMLIESGISFEEAKRLKLEFGVTGAVLSLTVKESDNMDDQIFYDIKDEYYNRFGDESEAYFDYVGTPKYNLKISNMHYDDWNAFYEAISDFGVFSPIETLNILSAEDFTFSRIVSVTEVEKLVQKLNEINVYSLLEYLEAKSTELWLTLVPGIHEHFCFRGSTEYNGENYCFLTPVDDSGDWVENNYHHLFRIDELSNGVIAYTEINDIELWNIIDQKIK